MKEEIERFCHSVANLLQPAITCLEWQKDGQAELVEQYSGQAKAALEELQAKAEVLRAMAKRIEEDENVEVSQNGQ